MLKILSFLGVVSVSLVFAVGFIYDSVLLESFHIEFYQLMGAPIEYLAHGYLFLLQGISKKFSYIWFVLGVIGCGYKPLERKIQTMNINKFLDIKSIPFILISLLIPLLLMSITPIANAAKKEAAALIKNHKNQTNTITYANNHKEESHRGFIVRNRNGMILFYDVENSVSILVPQRNLLHDINE